MAHIYAVSGHRDKARAMLEELKGRSKPCCVSPFDIALIYTGLGEKDQALKWLEVAYKDKSLWMIFLKVDPRFDNLRSDPRFTDLLQRIGHA